MKNTSTCLALFLSLILDSCLLNPEKLSNEEIISRTIEFHDPYNNWHTLRAEFHFDSQFSFADSTQEDIVVQIEVAENNFKYDNKYRKVALSYPRDTCMQESENGSCEQYRWTKNFYTYIWGLPMKLKDPGIHPEKETKKTFFNNYKCHVVPVHYEKENFLFYIDTANFQLRGFEFHKNDSSGKGEKIVLKDLYEFNHIKFPRHKTYIILPENTLGGTNEVKLIRKLP